MDPTRLIPSPDVLPAPWGLFALLSILTFTLHLIMANALLGVGLIAFVSHFFKKVPEPIGNFPKEVGTRIPMSIAFAVNLGVPPLLFLQVLYGQFIYVSSVLMAAYWLSIFVLIILAYYSAYLYAFKYDRLGKARVWLIGLSVVLLLVVGFFFTNSLLLMIDPKAWPLYFERPGGKIIHLSEPTLIPRYLHFVVSSVAIGGLVMGLFGWWRERQGSLEGRGWASQGLTLFGCATLAQFFIGAWYLGGLPEDVLSGIFLEDQITFPLFLGSIMIGGASILFSFSKKPWHTAICALLTVFLMVLFRNAVRKAYLEPYLASNRPEVATQLGPILMFVISLVIGLGVIAYLLSLALRTGKEPRV